MASHHYLSHQQRIALIYDYVDGAGLSQRTLCDKYKISKGAVYNILQRKDEYKLIVNKRNQFISVNKEKVTLYRNQNKGQSI
jgi:Mor family transcriptional regulator